MPFKFPVSGYWMYKFRNVTAETMTDDDKIVFPDDVINGTVTVEEDKASTKFTELQMEWNSYLSIASMIPNVTFLLLNAVFGHR